MTPRLRNIIMFGVIAIAFVSVYLYFSGKDPEVEDLTSTADSTGASTGFSSDSNNQLAQDFLNLLLNVKTIKLNDGIFSTPAFMSLKDSSIVLTPDGNEGRPNPFAPLGVDSIVAPAPAAAFSAGVSPSSGTTAVPIMTPPIPMATPPGTTY